MTRPSASPLQHNSHVIEKVKREVKQEVESGRDNTSDTENYSKSNDEVYRSATCPDS